MLKMETLDQSNRIWFDTLDQASFSLLEGIFMHEPERLADLVNSDDWLIHRGRYVDTTFLLEVGDTQYLICIHSGKIESVTVGPFVMPCWKFALKASRKTWEKFCEPLPEPGYHDVMALVKYKLLKLEGDQHPFMANLLYFKDVLACMRAWR